MIRSSIIKPLAFLPFVLLSVAATNFTQCLIDFRNNSATGGVDYNGMPVTDSGDAVGLTYEACVDWCGTGKESFNWSVFSQQFSAWLLPWLALVSQLPFGAGNRLDNLISGEFHPAAISVFYQLSHHYLPVTLTVGSPTLAAFSLALTAINTYRTYDRFSTISYPNRGNAARALVYLQQVPLHITTRDGLLASLIVLPENDEWWECLVDRLEQTHTWTVAAATSIAWVVLAFAFTIVDSFMNLGKNVNATGQGVGSLWLWLVPVVVGWLWIPVCSYDKLKAAIDKANDLAFKATDVGTPRRAYDVSHMQAIRMSESTEVLTRDAARTAPVFNYARIWGWSRSVETIARAFEHAGKNARNHVPVNGGPDQWVLPRDRNPAIPRENRSGTVRQVQAYCGFSDRGEMSMPSAPSGMWKRIFIASVFALGLQWGITGSAVVTVVLIPTTGLGCRSASYILHGIISTMIWLALLLSSYLSHCAEVWCDGVPDPGFNSAKLAKGLATFLRRLSIFAAGCNAIGLVLVCVFQFSNFYSTCYCNSSVLGRGSKAAYSIMVPGNFGYDQMKGGWIGGVVLAGGCVFVFLLFLHLVLEPTRSTDHL